jgi:Sensors of blue-light using FAD
MSSSTMAFSSEDLDLLLQKARIYNSKHNITGLLLYIDRDFLQVLEGEKGDVIALFEKIEKDTRNNCVIPVFKGNVENRQFPDWNMGFSKSSYTTLQKDVSFKNISKGTLVNIEDKTAIIFIDSFVDSHKIEIVYT